MHRKSILTCLCIIAFLVCLGLIVLCFYSMRSPSSPLRDPTPSIIPHITIGNAKALICCGTPALFAGLTTSALKALWKRPA